MGKLNENFDEFVNEAKKELQEIHAYMHSIVVNKLISDKGLVKQVSKNTGGINKDNVKDILYDFFWVYRDHWNREHRIEDKVKEEKEFRTMVDNNYKEFEKQLLKAAQSI